MVAIPGMAGGFVAEDHKDDFKVIPAGDYAAVITKTELKPNSSGTGQLLVFSFEVVKGDQKGETVAQRLNIVHTKQVTQRIAQTELANICRACGVPSIRDTAELHNKSLGISVGVRKYTKADGTEGETNEVSGVMTPADFKAKTATPEPVAATAGESAPEPSPFD